MTCGIYALYWEEQDKIYIGLSQNIEIRWSEHKRDMQDNNHSNYLVQKQFIKHGLPTLYIIEEGAIHSLNSLEIYWTSEFNALNKSVGLCLVEPGQVGWGVNSNASKYSKIQILKVFSLLYKTSLPYKYICDRAKVPQSLITDLLSKRSHYWLSSTYPDKFSKIIARDVDHSYKYISTKLGHTIKLQDPSGSIFEVSNIREFCRTHPLLNWDASITNVGLGRLINGSRKSYKGWKLI